MTIDRTVPQMHLQVLAQLNGDPNKQPGTIGDPNKQPGTMNLRTLQTLGDMNNAIVAINGYYWGPEDEKGYWCSMPTFKCKEGTPTTPVFLDGLNVGPSPNDKEVLMGFTVDDSGIQAKRIPNNELFNPENRPYRQWMYGSEKTVMRDGVFDSSGTDDQPTKLSILGYSDRYIIFLISESDSLRKELASTLSAFGTTDAVLNDGGPSAELYIHGKPVIDPMGFSRKIAYGIGLVPGLPKGITVRVPGSTNAEEHRQELENAREQPPRHGLRPPN
ncbi:phosphodiester glycosidase family protein, partial [Corallococcus aberystwythensis]